MSNIRSISSSTTTTTTANTTTSNSSTNTSSNHRTYPFTSIGFSGAGFLGAYHCGVSSCLLKHHYLLQPMERIPSTTTTTNETSANMNKVLYPPILTGVSAGSIISSAISIGVSTNDAMDVLYEINKRTNTKSNILFNSLTPGFSLVDQVEDLLYNSFRLALGGSSIDMNSGSSGSSSSSYEDYDNELLMNRISHGSLLHIGLSDKRKMKQYIQSNLLRNNMNILSQPQEPTQQQQQQNQYQHPMNVIKNIKGNRNLYVYVNQYRNLKDIVSACILSSYIPIGTGPLRTGTNSNSNSSNNDSNSNENDNGAVRRAFETMKEMEYLGFVKDGITGEPIIQKHHDIRKEDDDEEDDDDEKEEEESYFLDGGLVNMFPSIDQSTLMVTPLHCRFSNNPYIAPKAISENNNRYVDIDDEVSIGMNMQNMKAAMKMLRSSDPSYLDEKFREGYDDATRFLKERNLLTVFTL